MTRNPEDLTCNQKESARNTCCAQEIRKSDSQDESDSGRPRTLRTPRLPRGHPDRHVATDLTFIQKAIDIQVVPDTPPAVIRTGRGRGRGKYRAQQKPAPRVGMRSSSRIMELEQREEEEAQAASARWPAQPNVTTQIETMTRQMHISEVPMNTQEELERVFPSGEEDAGTSSRQPPAAGLISRHRTHTTSLHLVLLVARGGVRPQPSTATLGLIH